VAYDLKYLEAEENGVAEAIEFAQQEMFSTSEEIKKAHQMIVKVQVVLTNVG